MKLLHSWAQDFVKVPKPEKIRDIFDNAGLPVESIAQGSALPVTIVLGHVLTVEKHPNADRLHVTTVDVGEKTARTIVCGAPNVAAMQYVAVALPGTTLPDGTAITTTSIRGAESNGMLCSSRELGLSDEHAGILTLQKGTPGTRIGKMLGLNEVVYDIAVLPNRPDALSIIGLSREIAAATAQAIPKTPAVLHGKGKSPISVHVQAKQLCPLYTAQYISGVTIQPSPSWMQQRLQASGVRPINIVVDVTNYVMLELGQPLHAFDASRVDGKSIVVRTAQPGTEFKTLDGIDQTLTVDMLVIADAKTPIALAGVMGGEASAVSEHSTNIILEAAVFSEQSVYGTSHALHLVSESSARFSKGVDPAMTLVALGRATALLHHYAGAQPVGTPVVVGATTVRRPAIAVSVKKLNTFLGTKIAKPTIVTALTRFGCVVKGSGDKLKVTPPSYRHDLALFEDIAEEVARFINYDAIPRTVPKAPGIPVLLPRDNALIRQCSELLARAGAYEHVGYSYVPEEYIRDGKSGAVRIRNPLSRDQAYLRTSLIPGLFSLAARNKKRYAAFRIFEIGKAYHREKNDFVERDILACLWAEDDALRTLKGVLEAVLHRVGAQAAIMYSAAENQRANICLGSTIVGSIGIPAQRDIVHFKLPPSCAWASIDLTALLRTLPEQPHATFSASSEFPAVKRDIAFWTDGAVSYNTMMHAVQKADPLLVACELFDVFAKDNKYSLAFHLTFCAPDRTLTAAEADASLACITAILEKKFHIVLRK